jgi:hypothetical protein
LRSQGFKSRVKVIGFGILIKFFLIPQTYLTPGKGVSKEEEYILDDVGFAFVKKCIDILEKRGLEEEGLYRVSGVGTKINKVLKMGLDGKKTESERLAFFTDDQYSDVLESKTIASALKQYLRKLKEPLMTYRYFNGFLAAASEYLKFSSNSLGT